MHCGQCLWVFLSRPFVNDVLTCRFSTLASRLNHAFIMFLSRFYDVFYYVFIVFVMMGVNIVMMFL